jgi:uncharacterized RDD family membrane protein YckC
VKAPSTRNARAVELQGRRAGFVSRFLADAIDLLVLWAVWVALLLLASVARYLLLGSPFVLLSAPPVLEGPVSFVTGVLYLGYFWGTTGRTPGKLLLGLRVVNPAERRLGAWPAVARAILCLVFPAGLLWVLVSRRNASVQDLAVRSVVVYDWTSRPAWT